MKITNSLLGQLHLSVLPKGVGPFLSCNCPGHIPTVKVNVRLIVVCKGLPSKTM